MGLFRNPLESHAHSMKVLNLVREYDTFLESLSVVADMGCGSGLDALWFAGLETRDDDPEPMNYTVYCVDKDLKQLDPEVKQTKNIITLEGDFEERIIPRQVDLMWAHDVFQYARNPMKCLATWKDTINTNGMLILSVPQTTYFDKTVNKLVLTSYSHQYYSYNLLNLIYMLATAGFDCRDAYFYREPNTPWLYAAVYASEHKPFTEPVTWYDLAEKNLISDNLINSVQRHGYARMTDIIVSWFNRENYYITD